MLIAMWGALGWSAVVGDHGAKHGPHPTRFATDPDGNPLPGLLVGKDNLANDQSLFGPGLVFSLAMIGLFTATFLLAANDASHRRLAQVCLAVVGIVFAAGIAYLFFLWHEASSSVDETEVLLGPFPQSTSIMMLVTIVIPLVFAAIYVIGFPYWYPKSANAIDDEGIAEGRE